MRFIYIALVVLATALVVLFKVQNLETATVAFLNMSVTLPVSVLVLVVYVLGMLTGGALFGLLKGWLRKAMAKPE